jgi:alpha-galactosidase
MLRDSRVSDQPEHPSRRTFLGDAIALGASSLVLPPVLAHARTPARTTTDGGAIASIAPDSPVRVYVDHDGSARLSEATRGGARYTTSQGATVTFDDGGAAGLTVKVSAPATTLARIVLRWPSTRYRSRLVLGDAWERGYGDLQWRFVQPERVLPWYFAAHDPKDGSTLMHGVKTQPNALCFWTVDDEGISLWLDFRNGGSPSRPGDREITAATIVSLATSRAVSPLSALRRFCRAMCPAPRLSATPICGNNNWYYAYGKNFDADAMRRDAAFLAEISAGHEVRPYCVIDAGWTPGSSAPGGPWTSGDPATFPDMPGLAADMKKLGVRPGIWMRPTALSKPADTRRLRAGPSRGEDKPLDLTMPENLTLIRDDVARVKSWGYELIKHDFSTYDAFGRWGFEMGAELTDSGWSFADWSLTNAEIIKRLYRTLREAAGDVVLLGCNTIGHLAAGLFEIQRTGDDTSGHAWERTRRMGVNTLAYRLPQHGTFFSSDPDCAAHTERTPWELDRQFLDLVARSGTALFVSVDPRTVTADQKAAYRAAMMLALSGGEGGGGEPLDWLHTTAPREWSFGSRRVTYRWEEGPGVLPLRI